MGFSPISNARPVYQALTLKSETVYVSNKTAKNMKLYCVIRTEETGRAEAYNTLVLKNRRKNVLGRSGN